MQDGLTFYILNNMKTKNYFYIASMHGDLHSKGCKIGVSDSEKTLSNRLKAHKTVFGSDFEFSVIFKMAEDGNLYSQDGIWFTTIYNHTPESLESKLKILLHNKLDDPNPVPLEEYFSQKTPIEIIKHIENIDGYCAVTSPSDEKKKRYLACIIYQLRDLDWIPLGVYLFNDTDSNITELIVALFDSFGEGKPIILIDPTSSRWMHLSTSILAGPIKACPLAYKSLSHNEITDSYYTFLLEFRNTKKNWISEYSITDLTTLDGI